MAAALTRKNEYTTKILDSKKVISIIVHSERSQLFFSEDQWKKIKQGIYFIAFFSEQLTLTPQRITIGKHTLKIPSQYNAYIEDIKKIIKSDNWRITARIYKPGASPLLDPHRRRSLLVANEPNFEALIARRLGQKKQL